jgi:hypothetical protein
MHLLSRCRKYGVDNAHEQQPLSQILLNIQSRRHDLWTQIDLTMTFNLIEYIKTSSPYTSEISKLLVPRSKTIWHLSYTSASIKLVSASAAESATDQNNERIAYRGPGRRSASKSSPDTLLLHSPKGQSCFLPVHCHLALQHWALPDCNFLHKQIMCCGDW